MKKLTFAAIFTGFLIGALAASWQILIDFSKDLTNSHSFADAVAIAAPSVVNIYTSTMKAAEQNNDNPVVRQYFNQQRQRSQSMQEISLGSGVIMHESGYIITNLHVIKNATEILILLFDGRQANAKVVGIDQETDLAVLQIPLQQLVPVQAGSSEAMRVGDKVLAIGNPYGFGQTVTSGIVSAKGRYGLNLNTYENYIQTDAAINVGSSGGALINTRGELIGINTANYTQSGGSQGIALATPIETIAKVITDIIKHGFVVRGWLGLEVAQINPDIAARLNTNITNGIVITRTQAGSPAQKAGLKAQDIVLSIQGKPITSGHQGLFKVADLVPGEEITIEVLRNNQKLAFTAIIGIRPDASEVRQ